jgi:hypothetical protein
MTQSQDIMDSEYEAQLVAIAEALVVPPDSHQWSQASLDVAGDAVGGYDLDQTQPTDGYEDDVMQDQPGDSWAEEDARREADPAAGASAEPESQPAGESLVNRPSIPQSAPNAWQAEEDVDDEWLADYESAQQEQDQQVGMDRDAQAIHLSVGNYRLEACVPPRTSRKRPNVTYCTCAVSQADEPLQEEDDEEAGPQPGNPAAPDELRARFQQPPPPRRAVSESHTESEMSRQGLDAYLAWREQREQAERRRAPGAGPPGSAAGPLGSALASQHGGWGAAASGVRSAGSVQQPARGGGAAAVRPVASCGSS